MRRLSAAAVRRPRRRLGRRLGWWFGVQRLAGGRPHRPSAVRQLGAATRCGGSVRRLRRRLRGRLGRRLVVVARCGCSGGCSVRRLRRRLRQRLGWWLGERRLTSGRPHRAPASRASNHHHPPVPHVEQAPARGGRRRRWVEAEVGGGGVWRRGNVEAAGDAGGGVVRDLAVGLCVQTGFGIVARYWGQKGQGSSRSCHLLTGPSRATPATCRSSGSLKTLVILQRSREDGGEQETWVACMN